TMRYYNHQLLLILCLRPSRPTLFPYTTLFRSAHEDQIGTQPLGRDRGHGRTHPINPRLIACRRHYAAQGSTADGDRLAAQFRIRSEEHTSELQSRFDLVCRLLLEKKKYI